MTRRNLLKSLLGAPFLPLVWREKAEVPVAEPVVEPFEFLDSGAVPLPLEGETGQTHFSGYIVRCEDNVILPLPASVEPGKQYWCVVESTGTGMAFEPSRGMTITNILGPNP